MLKQQKGLTKMDSKTYTKTGLSAIIKDLSVFNIAKLLLVVVSLSSLLLTSSYVHAILKLENAIVGFIMFMFILMSVMTLFQSVRMHEDKALSLIGNTIIIIITVVIGYQLYKICNDAFLNQAKLNDPEIVKKAIGLIRNELIGFVVGAILLVVQTVKTLR